MGTAGGRKRRQGKPDMRGPGDGRSHGATVGTRAAPSPKFPATSAIPRLTQGSRHVVGLTGVPITPLCAPFIYTGSHCQPMPSGTTQSSPPRSYGSCAPLPQCISPLMEGRDIPPDPPALCTPLRGPLVCPTTDPREDAEVCLTATQQEDPITMNLAMWSLYAPHTSSGAPGSRTPQTGARPPPWGPHSGHPDPVKLEDCLSQCDGVPPPGYGGTERSGAPGGLKPGRW